jgi:hypothetical protein
MCRAKRRKLVTPGAEHEPPLEIVHRDAGELGKTQELTEWRVDPGVVEPRYNLLHGHPEFLRGWLYAAEPVDRPGQPIVMFCSSAV